MLGPMVSARVEEVVGRVIRFTGLLSLLLLLVPLPLAGGARPDGEGREPAPAVRPAWLARPVVLGASVSNGAGLAGELEVPTPFAFLADAALTPGEPSADLGDFFFFTDPVGRGARLVERALEASPTLVVALDFLFWYAFGDGIDDRARPARLELGLAQLARFDVPILVGDLPDVGFALDGYSALVRGPLIRPNMLPAPELRERMNRRLAEWVAERPNAVLVPLAEFVAGAQSGADLNIGGVTWEAGSFERFLQRDRLHPNLEGALALTVLAFHTLAEARADLAPEVLCLDPGELRRRVLERTEPARRERLERRERMRERRSGGGGADGGGADERGQGVPAPGGAFGAWAARRDT